MELTHRVDVYRPSEASGGRGTTVESWSGPLVQGVRCNLQPRSGSKEISVRGKSYRTSWQGFVPPGELGDVTLRPFDGLLVLDGWGPDRHQVGVVSPQGPDWDVEIELVDADSDFGEL